MSRVGLPSDRSSKALKLQLAALSILKWKKYPHSLFFRIIHPPQSILVWRPPQWYFTIVRVNYRFPTFKCLVPGVRPNNFVNVVGLFFIIFYFTLLFTWTTLIFLSFWESFISVCILHSSGRVNISGWSSTPTDEERLLHLHFIMSCDRS